MALHLKLKPQTLALNPLRSRHPFCSSSSSSHGGGGAADDDDDSAAASSAPPSPPPSFSSYFSDIKERLKAPPAPPRRIPTNPPPPPSFSPPRPSTPTSLEEIRKQLAGFRSKSSGNTPSSSSSSSAPISFQELFKNNVLNSPPGGGGGGTGAGGAGERMNLDSIRESLRQFRPSLGEQTRPRPQFNFKAFQDSLLERTEESEKGSTLLGRETLPGRIFGRDMRERKGEEEQEGEKKPLKTEFVKSYSYEELGEKLKNLRPEAALKGKEEWFSLQELNERLAELRKLEEKQTQSRMGGVSFQDLRDSLTRLKEADANKKANMQRLSILASIGGQLTPSFMLKPPQEHLLENYFHPDHMSSAEKMKLELKKVRDEFKMSESDCGSTRVQIAQLTTKIKHLSGALHKKDKHSRKGLQEMVQRRKKLLKYLRRTDWDSYCLVLSKLGLRDVPEYKTPDYKA